MKTYISTKRISQAFVAVFITAVIIYACNFFFTRKDILLRKTVFDVGQISNKTIVAPFNFFIYQDEKILAERQKVAEQKVLPRYNFSSDATFKAQENINRFFDEFEKIVNITISDSEKIAQLSKKGFTLSYPSFSILSIKKDRQFLYEQLFKKVGILQEKGIVINQPSKNKILITDTGIERELLTNELLTTERAKEYFIENNKELVKDKKWETLLRELLDMFIIENVIFDEKRTQKAVEQARASVPHIVSEVLKNELIIQEHQKITEDIYRKLRALELARENIDKDLEEKEYIISEISQFIYIVLVLSLFIIFFYFFQPQMLATVSLLRISLIFTIVLTFLLIVVQTVADISPYIVPFGMPIILLAFLVNVPAAIIFGLVNFFLFIGILNWNFTTSFIIAFSGTSAVLVLTNPRSRGDFYNATFYMLIFFVLLTLLFCAIKSEKFLSVLPDMKWGFFGVVISLIGSMVLLAPIEQRLPVITNIHLLELGDFSRPLLKRLSEVASGTYHHSIIVGNLAEAAAKSIDANSFLARVSSYYHDIGKTKNPEYFIENVTDIDNPHNNLSSSDSAKIVKRHVEDGVKLAKENHIPRGIIDIIQQHHGTSQISYFYKQSKNDGEKINKEDFYYNGPKPQSKESAIVMIADIVESSTKSLDNPAYDEIKDTVRKVINKLVKTEQLSESSISLQELKIIQESIMPILVGIYQKRIVYPT
ncbi:MAG: HDIG domain-containing protein [Candidatus Cloacimonetes bacterium]|nr:HDIG domain-containing protein [Candidatus Cloacimonadota bacterium]